MADITPPTYDEFTERFPQFSESDEDVVTAYLTEALRFVDDSWITGDQQIAIMYLVAHWLESEGDGTGGSETVIPGAIQSESFGPISRSYATGTSLSANTNFNSTIYGRRFVELQVRSHPAIFVI